MSRRELIKKSQSFMQKMSQVTIKQNRRAAIVTILNEFDGMHINEPGRNVPLDLFLRYYFLRHKREFDSAARFQIVDMIYTLQRYKGYLNAISSRQSTKYSPDEISWSSRLKAFTTPDFADLFDHPSIPEHARCSISKPMYEQFVKSHGPEEAFKICRTCLERP